MKLFTKKKVSNVKVETLDKKQLVNVIGGTTTEIVEGKKGLNAVNVKLS
jgi:hypothetical protein